ncbi:MAG: hypothetical protein IKS44_06930 [Bacteroidales bacterium]|nr:hypothetical protein [Bacteroidales bacterium]
MFKKPTESPADKIAASPQFKSFMRTLAIAGVACTVVGLLFKMRGLHTGATLLIVGISVLAIVAIFLGQLFPYPVSDNEAAAGDLRPMWKFVMTLTGYSLAVAFLGLLFRIMLWPGGMMMLAIGVVSLLLCGIAWLFVIHKKNSINNH